MNLDVSFAFWIKLRGFNFFKNVFYVFERHLYMEFTFPDDHLLESNKANLLFFLV